MSSEWKKCLLCVAVLVLAPLLLLGSSVLGGKTYLPFDVAEWAPVRTMLDDQGFRAVQRDANHDSTEVTLTFRPEWKFASAELRSGRLPEWNPYARIGAPLLATSVVGLLYPPNWLLYCYSDPADGFGLCAWIAFVIAGVGMFGFLRELALSRPAALFGALAFQLCGTLTANAHFYQRLNALVWLPTLLWTMHVLARSGGVRRRRGVVGLALATFFTWTAGFAPYAAPATLTAGFFLLWLALQEAKSGGLRAATSALACGGSGFALGFLLAAIQLLPMFAFFPESNRTPHPTLDSIANQGFDPLGLLGYLMPDAFGNPLRTTGLPYEKSPFVWWLYSRTSWVDGKPFLPNYNFIEYAVFPGTLVGLLAVLAVTMRSVRMRWILLGIPIVLHVLANASQVLMPLLRLPGLESVPPMRFVGPACVFVAALGAAGFAEVFRANAPRRSLAVASLFLAGSAFLAWTLLGRETGRTWLDSITPDLVAKYRPLQANASPAMVDSILGRFADAGLQQMRANLLYAAVLLALGALWLLAAQRWRAHGGLARALAGLALVAIGGELVGLGEPLNRGRNLLPETDTAVHRFLREARDRYAPDGGITVARAGYDIDPITQEPRPTLPFQLPPCTLVPEHIRDLHIYTFVDGRSHKCFTALYLEGHMHREFWPLALLDDDRLTLPFFDLLGLRYLLATQPLVHAGRKVGPEWKGPGGEFFVYERPSPLPRAFVVGATRSVGSDDLVVAALVSREFRPREEVLLVPEDAVKLLTVPLDPASNQRRARFTLDSNNHIVIAVEDGPPGLLVLADTCMSGWTATVDGRPTEIVRGNLFCRVVPLPAGACTVDMRYRTPRLFSGAVLTCLAALALVLLARRRGFVLNHGTEVPGSAQ